MLYKPIGGFCNTIITTPQWEIKPDKQGYFKTVVELTSPNMLTIQVGQRPVWLFVEPCDTIELNIDLNKFTANSPNGGLMFKGKNAAGNEYFNSFNYQPGKKLGDFDFIVNDSLKFHQTHDLKSVDFALGKITATFDSLLKRKEITQKLYDFTVPGIKADLLGIEIKYFLLDQKQMPFKEGVKFAEKIYERYPVTKSIIQHSIFGNNIAHYYYRTIASKFYSTKNLADSIFSINGKKIFVNKNLVYWMYAPPDVQEVFWPLNLISLKRLFADSYDKDDVSAFLTLHPNSPVKKYLQAPYFGNFNYNLSKEIIDSSLIKLMAAPTSHTLKTFLATNFKGQKLFVDFWASWCAPCKQEFQFNYQVDSFCSKYNITRLYVSFDEPVMKNSMINNIYAYNLKGYHTTVNDYLFQDIKNLFYPGKQFSIPKYLLVDENGEVINADAPRPSDTNKLLNTIKTDFKINDDL